MRHVYRTLLKQVGMCDIAEMCKEWQIGMMQKLELKAAVEALKPHHDDLLPVE